MKISGIIFGGVFFLAGLTTFYFFVLSTLCDAFHMQSWQPTPANLNRADIGSYQSRNDDGSYTTMYSVDMEYEYWVGDRHHIGTRVDIRGDSSSDSDEHYQRLYKIKQESEQKRLSVWVNPIDPSDSIYDRTINIRLTAIMTLFASVFMFVGGGIVKISRKKEPKLPMGITPDPNKPWTTRAEWATPTIYSNANSKLGLIKFFSILSVLFFGMFSIALFGQHPVATVFSFLLWLPSYFLYRWYKKKKIEWDHFQKVPLQLAPYPGVIGGAVAGSILVPSPYNTGDNYTFTLQCTHHWTTRSGNETRSHSSILWSETIQPTPKAKVNGTYLAFQFKVPADKDESSKPENNYHRWTISISSKLKGIDFNRDYEIPVFITEKSQTVEDELKQQPLTASQKSDMHARLAVNHDKDINSQSINHTPDGKKNNTQQQRLSLHTPGSNAGWFIGGLGTLFFIIGTVIATVGGSNFGIVFAAVASVFIALGVYALGRNCQISVEPNRIEISVFLFTKIVNHHVLAVTDIREIKPYKSSTSSQHGKQANEKYGLRLFTKSGKMIDLGGEFKSMKNATHMKLEIEQCLSHSAT